MSDIDSISTIVNTSHGEIRHIMWADMNFKMTQIVSISNCIKFEQH